MSIVSVLERELGADAIVGPGHEKLDDYGRDESPLPEFYPPECVVLCSSVEHVKAVLAICMERTVWVGSGAVKRATGRGVHVVCTRCTRATRAARGW